MGGGGGGGGGGDVVVGVGGVGVGTGGVNGDVYVCNREHGCGCWELHVTSTLRLTQFLCRK